MSFSELYKAKPRVFSFEYFPPKREEDLETTRKLIQRMTSLRPDFITVTYGAGGGSRARTGALVSYVVNELQYPAAAHLTCVHHTIGEIDAILDSLAENGIRHVVALRGDPSAAVTAPGPLFPGFQCARDLVRHIRKRGDFSIAVAGYPEGHPKAASPQADMDYLAEKVDAGAELILTQLFFDADVYFSFADRARAAGINIPIVPGILPIAGAKQLRQITEKCGASVSPKIFSELASYRSDAAAEQAYGTGHAVKLCNRLLEGGAPGIHFYTLNKSLQVEEVLKVLRGLSAFS